MSIRGLDSHKSGSKQSRHHDFLPQRQLQTGHESPCNEDDRKVENNADGCRNPNESTEIDAATFLSAIPVQPCIAHWGALEDDGEHSHETENPDEGKRP